MVRRLCPDLCVLFLLRVALIESKYNKIVYLPGTCSSSRIIEIDGAVIKSTSNSLYHFSSCTQKYMGDVESFGKIKVKIRGLSIRNRNTKLDITDGTPHYKYTRTFDHESDKSYTWNTYNKYVTIQLRNGGWGEKFQITLTSFPTGRYKCGFRCYRNANLCIDKDLRCDGYQHCYGGEDERDCSSLKRGGILGIVIGLIILAIIVIVIVVLCIRRRRQAQYVGRTVVTTQPAAAHQTQPPPGGAYPTYGGQEMKPPAGPGYGVGTGWSGAAPTPPAAAAPYPQAAKAPYPQQAAAAPYPPQQPVAQPDAHPPYPVSDTASAPPLPPS